MGFPGKENMAKDSNIGGGWIRLKDDEPQRLSVIGYSGTQKSKKYDNTQYVFDVVDSEGSKKKLGGSWRLMKALQEKADELDSPFTVTITQKKIIAEIEQPDGTKKKQLVNEYTLEELVKYVDDEIPF